MNVCLMIEGQENVTWDQWVGLAMACEEHGFDGLFRSDHYVSFGHPTEYGNLDAWTTLAALGTQTTRIRLGTLVSPVTFRHPSHLAKAVVTADHVSGGRVELGMGAGWFEGEHRTFGFPFPSSRERMDMLEEQVEIVHRLWDRDEEQVSFQGRHYRVEAAAGLFKPLQDPHPRLIIGGDAGPRSARIAARWADEYNAHFPSPERYGQARDALDAACEAIGRDAAELGLSMMTTTLVGEDREELEARASRLIAWRGDTGDPGAFLEKMSQERLAGTPDQVLERLGDYARAGVQRVMMQHLLHDDLEMVALIGRTIIPGASTL
jgi:F420-dependent oxidoreductase-like protein